MGINVLDIGGKADAKCVSGIEADGVSDTNAVRKVNNDTGGNTDIYFDTDTNAIFLVIAILVERLTLKLGQLLKRTLAQRLTLIMLPKSIEILALTSTPTRMLVVILTIILNLFVTIILIMTLM